MNDDLLNHIDLCMASAKAYESKQPIETPQATLCALVSTEQDFVHDELATLGFDSYAALPDFHLRRPYERSSWCRVSSTGRAVPSIYALAIAKYGRFSPALKPFWVDGDYMNDRMSNVALMPLAGALDTGNVRNKYGVRSTTPEYRKRYYADPKNKARNAEHQRATQARKKAKIAAAQAVVQNTPDLADRLDQLKKKLGLD